MGTRLGDYMSLETISDRPSALAAFIGTAVRALVSAKRLRWRNDANANRRGFARLAEGLVGGKDARHRGGATPHETRKYNLERKPLVFLGVVREMASRKRTRVKSAPFRIQILQSVELFYLKGIHGGQGGKKNLRRKKEKTGTTERSEGPSQRG